ncbi:hypothetical protein DQ04_05521050 [Trypanosoma grayi]|uniref:hypothetical protein n=1 Tax=Trypanosoma grayi TaxID=71804 RepID=UPI0004F48E50|nr:hypothetical protein DQ04_05521050 [Trypanosoma grayi]KEG09263.1 hypothetical protein DQ04_05521050 [Trypanosoma grayi]
MPRTEHVVIFLDIDGVLLPVPRFTFGGGDLSEGSVRLLQQIVDGCGGAEKVSIILSSTWRNFPEQVNRLNQFFAKVAANHVPPVAGGTPNGTPKVTAVTYYADDPSEQRLVRDRVDEIIRWIRTHMHDYPEAVGGRWLAIDDMQLDVDERMHGHFLKTETEVGLTEEAVARALNIVASLPSPEVTARNAEAAIIDPVLKDEEIDILETRCRDLSTTVDNLKDDLQKARAENGGLQAQRREWEREKKETERRLEDVSYRLAQYEFAKKNAVLQTALTVLASKTGKDRRELEEHIKTLVNLMRKRKELEKAAAKKQRRAKGSRTGAGAVTTGGEGGRRVTAGGEKK